MIVFIYDSCQKNLNANLITKAIDQLQIVKLQAIANVLKNAMKEHGHLTTVLSQTKYRLHPIYLLCFCDFKIVYLFENLSE
ncbi:MAG: hypothetical protein JRF30_11250 [Deltaproteobacteria bacterium]|nr:hypothetical protein [Deltaproteobacteria bacterium]MBW1794552.1 hypothetical protein [Deltaproteobacteria bacterium]MBW2331464.1 hypothetical protein [Deltaproteobacteria bacterium]